MGVSNIIHVYTKLRVVTPKYIPLYNSLAFPFCD